MRAALLALIGFWQALPAWPTDHDRIVGLMSDRQEIREKSARDLTSARDPSLVPGLVDALFFTPKEARGELLSVLRTLTGEDAGSRYHDWVALVGRRKDLAPGKGYLEWKLSLLSRIDTAYRKVLYADAPARIRLEEIVWGGVRLDGIPSLDDPPKVAAAEAGLTDEERVFGVSVGREHRAYPLRYLSWHEMANDVLGGEPITLSYCTLCRSGVVYSARTSGGGAYRFGTSGLLYRSNKLMYDRSTFSLWSNITGEAVLGRLAGSSVRLEMRPVSLTSWANWRTRHPDTTVVKLPPSQGTRWNFDYRPGAADRARAGVSFPVWLKSAALGEKDEVFGIDVEGSAKAYPVKILLAREIVNDSVGGLPLVLLGDRQGEAVRAYRRGDRLFRAGTASGELLDETGRVWRIEEAALTPDVAADAKLEPLGRLPGQTLYWFAWFAFHPQTEVHRDAAPRSE